MIRAGMLQAGCGMLGRLLGADPGYRGPRVPCGQGHEAGFVSYWDKVIDTVLGPVTLTRAWYHCAACKHGLAPRDAELGVPAPVMQQDPRRGQRPRQAARQARLIGQMPQQRRPGMRHDPCAAAGHFQTPRPPGNVHCKGAPGPGLNKNLNTPYRPSSGALFYSGTPVSPHTSVKGQG